MKTLASFVVSIVAGPMLFSATALAASAWPGRGFDQQNTGNVGTDPALTESNVTHLAVEALLVEKPLGAATDWAVNATPVISDGLLFIGDSQGYFHVVELASGRTLVRLETGAPKSGRYAGIHSTATIADVSLPSGAEERRVYIGANETPKTLYCLSVAGILAANAESPLTNDSGADFLCAGASWPIEVRGLGNPSGVYDSTPLFANDQMVLDPDTGTTITADVLYTATIGLDCADGQFWAIDAYSAKLYWAYDPVPNFQDTATPVVSPGYGGVVWTAPARGGEQEDLVYVTTGDCVQQPAVGFQAESIVALDPVYGTVAWFHQRRLVDATDFDTGNGPTVVDVPGECAVVISPDKDGCIYAFPQDRDIPQVGDLDLDPRRPGQQRLLWRTCLMPGWGMSDRGGGFNAHFAVAQGRTVFVQTQVNNTVGIPGDDVGYFALDACTGELEWATSDVRPGRSEAAIASGMIFQASDRHLQVLRASGTYALLATVDLGRAVTPGGGGPAVVNGKIYVPTYDGVVVVGIDPSADPADPPSPPTPFGTSTYSGPFPHPVAPEFGQVILPLPPPYDWWPEEDPVETWPSMNPELAE